MMKSRDELIEKAIQEILERGAVPEDVTRLYGLAPQELEILKVAREIYSFSIASTPSLPSRTKRKILKKLRQELRSKRFAAIFKKIAIAFSALLITTGSISYAAYKAPPDSYLYGIRKILEEATFILAPGKEEKAKKILESASKHAELANEYRAKNKNASEKAYKTAKKRLIEYLQLKKSIKKKPSLLNFEEKAAKKYIEAKRKIAPKETTIILKTEKETPSTVIRKKRRETPQKIVPPTIENNPSERTYEENSDNKNEQRFLNKGSR